MVFGIRKAAHKRNKNIVFLILKETSTLRHIKDVYIEMFVMYFVILVLISWLVLYFCYFWEMLAVVCHANATGGHC